MANVIATPMMSFGEAIKTCFKKYATFSGRARRSEYWWFALFTHILSSIPLYALITWKVGVKSDLEAQAYESAFDTDKMQALLAQAESYDTIFYLGIFVLGFIALALLIPSLAVMARRLHDKGKNAWLILLLLIPIVNIVIAIVFFIWFLMDGDKEDNQYGPSPKYIPQE